MCKHCERHNIIHKSDGSFLSGALFGAIIGTILGVLYAPDKGLETRKKLKKDADDFMDKAEPVVNETIKKAKPMIAKVKEDAGPLIEKAKQKINETLEDIGDELDKLEK